jgi:hypothetical protein
VIVRMFSRALRVIRRAWDESIAAHETLIEINTPWRHDGELRWQRRSGGWELHGHRVPDLPVARREPAAD